MRLISRPHAPLHHRQFAQLMEAAGVDVHKLNESIRRGRQKHTHLVGQRPQINKHRKIVAADTRVFRHGIQERRRSATQRAALDSQPDVIFLDTPFFIDPDFLVGSNIQPWNSTANFYLEFDSDVDNEISTSFYFAWRNDSLNDVLITAGTYFIAKGSVRTWSWALFGTAWVSALCKAQLKIMEFWNDPPSAPLFEDTQWDYIGSSRVDVGFYPRPQESDFQDDISRTYDLYQSNYFRVPARQTVVFEVGIQTDNRIATYLNGDGIIWNDFGHYGNFLACPFVEVKCSSRWRLDDQ